MARRRPSPEASRPTSRGMFISAFDADRQGTTSISTRLRPTSRCLQLQSICAYALELLFRGSKGNERAPPSGRQVAKIARSATPSCKASNRDNGTPSNCDRHPPIITASQVPHSPRLAPSTGLSAGRDFGRLSDRDQQFIGYASGCSGSTRQGEGASLGSPTRICTRNWV
jgi:hypothetical protein